MHKDRRGQDGTPFNLINVSFLIGSAILAVVGFKLLGKFGSFWPYIGAVAGMIIGYFAAPLVFFTLIGAIQVVIKIENAVFRRNESDTK